MVRRAPSPGNVGKAKGLVKIGGQMLSIQESLWVREYIKDWNGAQACLRAGLTKTENAAGVMGAELIRRPKVVLALHYLVKERARRIDIESDAIARYWYMLATADARELTPMKRRCCRHCWGEDFQFQYTADELRRAKRAHITSWKKLNKRGEPPLFDEQGGDGFDQTRNPNSECTECNGVGVWNPETIDFDNLSEGALLLYDGMKVYKDGSVELKLRNRDVAMRNFSELMGFIKPRKGVWDFDFDTMDDKQIDALLNEARSRGLMSQDELAAVIDVEPLPPREPSMKQAEAVEVDEDERVS